VACDIVHATDQMLLGWAWIPFRPHWRLEKCYLWPV